MRSHSLLMLLRSSSSDTRQKELQRLRSEMENLTSSLAAGIDPMTIKGAINERAALIEKLESASEAPDAVKITAKDLDAQASEVAKIAQSLDSDKKRAILRLYIAAMKAYPEKRTVTVTVQPLSTIYSHSLVGDFVLVQNNQTSAPCKVVPA